MSEIGGEEAALSSLELEATTKDNSSSKANSISSSGDLSERRQYPVTPMLRVFVGVTLVTVLIWLGWQLWQDRQQQLLQLTSLSTIVDKQLQRANKTTLLVTKNKRELARQSELLSQRINDVQLQLNTQGARLSELSSTTRSEWYLSEAIYLARLARQRLQTERSTKSPLALLEEVDAILRDLSNMDVLAVRAAVASDITALRLSGEIDVEGLILEINALMENIDQLTLIDYSQTTVLENIVSNTQSIQTNVAPQGRTERWSDLMEQFLATLSQFVRVKQRVVPIEPVLTVKEEILVRNNLRLLLQQASNAALREQQGIFDISLENAQQWLGQYFQMNSATISIQERLASLRKIDVIQQLPAIDASVTALETFMVVRQSRLLQEVVEDKPTGDAVILP
ncbi:MAG: uroporphyrinogen-III C-methyltransferase [Porticoccaceae bacterium]|nr:uroporphyrinogen-III C-methyltransferase [Porticoccaceae bacterium]MDG1474440.1 uroporphyrinogen-III C-methyltransferase [Porticoccaceae bacterium]